MMLCGGLLHMLLIFNGKVLRLATGAFSQESMSAGALDGWWGAVGGLKVRT